MARQMKDSGVEWIGEIPEEWKLARLSFLFEEINKKVSDKDFKPLSVTKQGILPQVEGVAKTDNGDNRKLVQKGNFVINSRSDRKGSSGVSEYEGSVSLINIVFRARSEINMQYMHHLLRSYGFQEEFYRWGHGIVADLWTTNSTDASNILLPYPEIEEQSHIATTLTTKCAEIDSVVEKTRTTIEEYKKLKQAIITQAVTKGIRANRPMIPSGVEWIGDIPEEWLLTKLKYNSTLNPKCSSTPLSAEAPVTFTPMENIKNGFYLPNEAQYGRFSENSQYSAYEENDIVFAKVTPCFENDNIAIMNNLINGRGFGSSELFVLRASNLAIRYLYYLLQNSLFKSKGIQSMTGTGGLKRVSSTTVRNYIFALPSESEQQEIAAYLDAKCAEIDRIIAKKEQLIEELGSYRKSLIYEYVTGKKEVTA